jgi:hypothetical protein
VLQLLIPPLGETEPPGARALLVFEVFDPPVKDGLIAPKFAGFIVGLKADVP